MVLDRNSEWKYLEVKPRDLHFKKALQASTNSKPLTILIHLSGCLFLAHSLINLCEPHHGCPIFTPLLVLAHSYLNMSRLISRTTSSMFPPNEEGRCNLFILWSFRGIYSVSFLWYSPYSTLDYSIWTSVFPHHLTTNFSTAKNVTNLSTICI